MNELNKYAKLTAMSAVILLSGCVNGGGYPNSNLAGGGMGAAAIDPMSAVEGAMLNSFAQNLINGQIGSQMTPIDQNFRLQQLGSMVQTGAVNQPQQWINPQTGSTIAVNPIGQNIISPQTQQQCQNLQEAVTLPNGQTISETRQACLNPQTGKWALVQ